MDAPSWQIRWPKHYTMRFKDEDVLKFIKDQLKLSNRHLWIEKMYEDGSIYVDMSAATMRKIEKLSKK